MEPGVSRAPATIESCAEPQSAKARAPSGRLTVDVKRDLDLSPEDVGALDALIESRPQVGVFLSKAWLSGFFAEPPEGFEPSLVLFRDGHTLRGVAPMAVCHSRAHVRVGLLGGGSGSDRVDLLAACGFEVACSDALVSWLDEAFERRAFIFELRDVPAESFVWGAIQRANAERTRGITLQPREVYTLPYLDLTESASRLTSGALPPAHSLKSLDKHRRWLENRGRLRLETLQDPGEVLAAFDSLTGFLHARWRGQGDGSALDRPRMSRFHRHVIPLLLRDGRLRMIRLSSDMRTIAVFYGLAVSGWRGYYLAGYDREWAGRIHLGQIMLAAAIDVASREGATEFDFLKGVERVKYLWPVRERSSLDADTYSENSASQFSRAARAAGEATSAFAKAARALVSSASHR
jgi:CelD/BcsL family acetyltransferase involved in cellulose biosynthesis